MSHLLPEIHQLCRARGAAKAKAVFVTGAAGFVGQRVLADLGAAGWEVRAIVRNLPLQVPPGTSEWIPLGDLAAVDPSVFKAALAGVDAVVHLAGRAHVMVDDTADPLAEYRRTNVVATLMLAEAAAKAGVRRFIFMSSVKAVAESSPLGGISDGCPEHPEDPYGISKREAEIELLVPGRFGRMTVTVLRPPLIYGPGVRANFGRLLRWASRSVPLPFGAVTNRRSLVYVGNLADAVKFCITSNALAGKACFVTDGEDVSTGDLVRRIAQGKGRSIWLPSVPLPVMRFGLSLFGRSAEADRLFGSLSLRMVYLPAAGWSPPFSLEQGLRDTLQKVND